MLSLHQSDFLKNDLVKVSKTVSQQDETAILSQSTSIYEPYIPKYVKNRLLQKMLVIILYYFLLFLLSIIFFRKSSGGVSSSSTVNGTPAVSIVGNEEVFAALVFADISGFTRLASKLNAEELKYHIK
jgi:hypothetical protein